MVNRVRSLVLSLLVLPGLLLGQTNHPAGLIYPSNRYLLLVETSRGMLNRSDMLVQSIQDLLASALASQARRGDSLGVWTFNEELHTGLLPLQQWAPENQKAISERIVSFLRAQRFENRGRFDKALPQLLHLVRSSPFLTVILVCVGDEEIHGTPFDQRVNEFFQKWRRQQSEARTPFVIVLRAQGGSFVDCSMNPAPWPVELPVLPNELFVAIPAPRPPGVTPQKQPPSRVPPLIIIGKKHEPELALTNKGPADDKSQADLPTTTNLALQSQANAPGADHQESSQKPLGSRVQTGSQETGPAGSGPGVPVLAMVANRPPVAQSAAPIPAAAKGPVAEQSLNQPVGLEAAQPPGGKYGIPEESALPVRARAAEPGQRLPGGSSTPVASVAGSMPVNVASATPARAHSNRTILCLAGVSLVGAALAAFLVWRRRARAPGEASLITESIDHRNR